MCRRRKPGGATWEMFGVGIGEGMFLLTCKLFLTNKCPAAPDCQKLLPIGAPILIPLFGCWLPFIKKLLSRHRHPGELGLLRLHLHGLLPLRGLHHGHAHAHVCLLLVAPMWLAGSLLSRLLLAAALAGVPSAASDQAHGGGEHRAVRVGGISICPNVGGGVVAVACASCLAVAAVVGHIVAVGPTIEGSVVAPDVGGEVRAAPSGSRGAAAVGPAGVGAGVVPPGPVVRAVVVVAAAAPVVAEVAAVVVA